jgi:hypothetical protein
MDMRIVGLLADMQQAKLRNGAARERASRNAPRLSPKAAALVVLAAFTSAAMCAAPVVLWAAWTLMARQMR